MIFIIVGVLVLIAIYSLSQQKKQNTEIEQRLEAEHSRLQRENPDHPNAKKGLAEFIIHKKDNAVKKAKKPAMIGLFVGTIISVIGILYIQSPDAGDMYAFVFFMLIITLFIVGGIQKIAYKKYVLDFAE